MTRRAPQKFVSRMSFICIRLELAVSPARTHQGTWHNIHGIYAHQYNIICAELPVYATSKLMGCFGMKSEYQGCTKELPSRIQVERINPAILDRHPAQQHNAPPSVKIFLAMRTTDICPTLNKESNRGSEGARCQSALQCEWKTINHHQDDVTSSFYLSMSCLTESSSVWSICQSFQLSGLGYLQGHLDVPTTMAPADASLSAVALPMPVEAPVMRTTLPLISCQPKDED